MQCSLFKLHNGSDFITIYSYQYNFRHDWNPLQSCNGGQLISINNLWPNLMEKKLFFWCLVVYRLQYVDLLRNEKKTEDLKKNCLIELSWIFACFLVYFQFIVRVKFAHCPTRILKYYRLMLQKPPILKRQPYIIKMTI